MTVSTLSGTVQGNNESLQSYIDQFTQVVMEVKGAKAGIKCWIFENDLLCDHPFRLKIRREKV